MSESSKGGSCGGSGEDDIRSDSRRRKGNGGTGESVQQSMRVFFSNASQSSEGGLPVPDIPVGIDGGNH